MELSELYSERILEIAGNPPDAPRLAHPGASARKVSRLCGSVIEVDIAVEDGRITGYGHEVAACALGQTSAAIVAREIVGTSTDEFRRVRDEMIAMLKADGPPPADLEERASTMASSRFLQLDTNATLVEAIALYRSGGYEEVEPFNDEPYANHWFRKRLPPRSRR